ncbi:MAG: UvrB/UvrC motif-containing protein [Phycisphaerales bacterium]|nr:UvrB/UvrC motif-containing protein [Phycisphaerales bacterium]
MSDIDLSTIFSQWPLGPDQEVLRLVDLGDGRQVIHVRIEMGLVQLEIDGRPDGLPSVFTTSQTIVDQDTAERLMHEASLHDYRGHLLLTLGCHAAALRDAEHVIRCAKAAIGVAATSALDDARRRGFTLRARAAAEAAIATGRKDLAREAISRGLTDLAELADQDQYETCNEVMLLRGMRDVLTPQLPSSQREELRQRLRDAVERENYELAAILRNELRQL